MAIPSGSGTEVLKRATQHNLNNTQTTLLAGTANHIYTIISIFCADQSGSSQTINIRVNDGSNDIYILTNTSLPANGSFVFNDKFVMEGDDILSVKNTGTQADWYVSYIDQDFS